MIPRYIGQESLERLLNEESDSEEDMSNNGACELSHRTKSHNYHYRDFETINWYRDLTIPSNKRYSTSSAGGIRGFLYSTYFAASGWIAVTLVGIITGAISYMLIISCQLLLSYRSGYCSDNLHLDEQQCNWAFHKIIPTNKSVDRWISYEQKILFSGSHAIVAKYVSHFIYVLISTCFAAASALITYTIAPYAINNGVPEVKTILNGFVIHGYLGVFTVVVKLAAVILAVSSGLNIGFESALVCIGAATGNIISRFFPKYRISEAKKREIISAGAAAGISCAFNGPISGLLFSFEEASHYFSFKTLWRTFWCTLVSALVCYHLYTPRYSKIILKLHYVDTFRMYELLPFISIGICGGLFGALFIKLFSFLSSYRKNSKISDYPIVEVILVTVLISTISFPFPLLNTDNHKLMYVLFGKCSGIGAFEDKLCWVNETVGSRNNALRLGSVEEIFSEIKSLSLVLFFKILFLILSCTLRIPNGSLFPTLTIGGVFGRIVGGLMKYLEHRFPNSYIFSKYCFAHADGRPCINSAIYAMIGSSAFLAGTTHMTVTLVVIMLELTDGAAFLVPVMIAVLVAKNVSKLISSLNIFEVSTVLNDYPFINLSILNISKVGTAQDILSLKKLRSKTRALVTLSLNNTKLSDIYRVLEHSYYSYPIIDDDGSNILVGSVVSHELYDFIKKISTTNHDISLLTAAMFSPHSSSQEDRLDLTSIVDYNNYVVAPSISVSTLVEAFNSLGLHCVHVARYGSFIDIITKKDLILFIKQKLM